MWIALLNIVRDTIIIEVEVSWKFQHWDPNAGIPIYLEGVVVPTDAVNNLCLVSDGNILARAQRP